MACFLLILTSVQFELTFDRFHENSDRLFRVAVRSGHLGGGEYSITTPEILSSSLRTAIPEVVDAGIVQRSRNARLQTETADLTEDGLFADEHFAALFSFEWIRGRPAEALAAPNSIVLTDALAERIFGSEDPMGRRLRYRSRRLDRDLRVGGVMRCPPKNSHLQFDYLVSAATLAADPSTSRWFGEWSTSAFATYVELRDRGLAPAVEKKAAALFREGRPQSDSGEEEVHLQPVTEIHLKSRVEGETATNDRIRTVSLYGAVGLLILLIAGINSMNLSTALATTRTKEVCLRKVIGAERSRLIRQFLGESYLFTGLALVLSLWLFQMCFPLMARFLGTGLTLAEVPKTPLVLSVLGTFLFVGAFSGVYPALVLSGFEPISILRNASGNRPRGIRIRDLLVVFQFTAVVALLVATLVVSGQLHFIMTTDPGYERNNVVIVPLREEETARQAQALKTGLLGLPGVEAVTVSDSTPQGLAAFIGGHSLQRDDGETFKMDFHAAGVDADFLEVFGMKIVAGRGFLPGDSEAGRGVVVNQALVRKTGWKNPLEERFLDAPVVGVVADFHFDTLHKEIEPAALFLSREFLGRVNLGVRIRPEGSENILEDMQRIFARTTAGGPFDFYFLDEAFKGLYRNERRMAGLIGLLEGLAVLLGGMGLFGLATYATKQRTKEIGIRKVLGASVPSVLRMISREFLVLVAVANILAWPLAYVFLRRWLQNFAYRSSLGIDVFVLAGLGSLLIAVLAVGLHTVKAASANPLESIRYE
jgi:putative ABC transport system permease protein